MWEVTCRRGFSKEVLKNSVAEWGQKDRGLGASRLREFCRWKWELRVPFSFVKWKRLVQSSNSPTQTFLDVPSGAFPDSGQGWYSKNKYILFVLLVGGRGMWHGWARRMLAVGLLRPLAFVFLLLHCNMQEAQNAKKGIFPLISISLLWSALLSLQMSPPSFPMFRCLELSWSQFWPSWVFYKEKHGCCCRNLLSVWVTCFWMVSPL